jgi:hypothetical protein
VHTGKLLKNRYIRILTLGLLAGYFLFAAALQYNDPDPLHWILLYAGSALLCFAALQGRNYHALAWFVCGMAAIEMAITTDGFLQWLRLGGENILATQMSAAKPYIELTREFFGSLISLTVAVVLLVLRRKRSSHAPAEN